MTIDLTSDLQVLAATIYGEARGEPLLGKQGVAAVVNNRALYAREHDRPQFGDGTLRGACLAKWQFSSWNENDPNRSKMLSLDFSEPDPVLQDCLDVATETVNGTLVDPTNNATFYKVTTLPWPASWGPEVPPLVVIGRHSFYNLLTEQPLVA